MNALRTDMFNMLLKETAYFSTAPDRSAECIMARVAREVWGPHTHAKRDDFHNQCMSVVISGKGRFLNDEGDWRLHSGSVFFFGPGHPHEVTCGPQERIEIIITDFSGRSASPMVIDAIGTTSAVASPANAPLVIAGAEHMYEVARSNQPFAHDTCVHLLRALLLTIRAGVSMSTPGTSAAEASFHACRVHMDTHFTAMTSTAQAAEAAHISHAYMCRLFARFAGTTPQVYLARLRMNHAADLLVTSAQSVKKIASQLGFADQYAFSKCFKRLMGASPRHYRERYVAARGA